MRKGNEEADEQAVLIEKERFLRADLAAVRGKADFFPSPPGLSRGGKIVSRSYKAGFVRADTV